MTELSQGDFEWFVAQVAEKLRKEEKEMQEWTGLVRQARDQGLSKSDVRKFINGVK